MLLHRRCWTTHGLTRVPNYREVQHVIAAKSRVTRHGQCNTWPKINRQASPSLPKEFPRLWQRLQISSHSFPAHLQIADGNQRFWIELAHFDRSTVTC